MSTTAPESSRLPIPWNWQSRYVPLLTWALSSLVLVLVPFRIIAYGYHPPDDALRHAAKVASGKSWDEILVMRPDTIDLHAGWHQILSWIHHAGGVSVDGLVVVSVVLLFLVFVLSPLMALRRVEAWTLALATMGFTSFWWVERLLMGRPFVLESAIVLTVLLAYEGFERAKTPWPAIAGLAVAVGLSVWIRGSWFLYLLPLAAVVCTRSLRAIGRIGAALAVGVVAGCLATGNGPQLLFGGIARALQVVSRGQSAALRVSELQPGTGFYVLPLVVFGFWLLRVARKRWEWRQMDHPAFYLIVGAWILSFAVHRFWTDYGVVAGLVLLVREYEDLLEESPLARDSVLRVGVTGLAGLTVFLAFTADVKSRWTWNLTLEYLERDVPSIEPCLPDEGGILYSISMPVFYQTFYANPHAPWRYALGFEATRMTEENKRVYHRIRWNKGAYDAYDPWVEKMTPADRLIIKTGSRSAKPRIEELEWHYAATAIWSGRLPRPGSDPAPPPDT